MSKCICMSNIRDPENRSNKCCVCGGHNHSNPKKNKHHNSTWIRLNIKKIRRFITLQKRTVKGE